MTVETLQMCVFWIMCCKQKKTIFNTFGASVRNICTLKSHIEPTCYCALILPICNSITC